MKTLTEAQAWRKIARRMAKRKQVQFLGGLCDEVYELWVPLVRAKSNLVGISQATRDRMLARIDSHLDGEVYAGPRGEWEFRVLAAYWLALESEE